MGARVEALFDGGDDFYPGRITAVVGRPGFARYDVQYDDGDFEPAVPRELVRLLSEGLSAEADADADVGAVEGDIDVVSDSGEAESPVLARIERSRAAHRVTNEEAGEAGTAKLFERVGAVPSFVG